MMTIVTRNDDDVVVVADLGKALGREVVTTERAREIFERALAEHPEAEEALVKTWGALVAMVLALREGIEKAKSQRDEAIRQKSALESDLWDAGTEYGRGELRQETVDVIRDLIDREEYVVERALRIFFDGGILDDYAVDLLDDLIDHLAHDPVIAKANDFEELEDE